MDDMLAGNMRPGRGLRRRATRRPPPMRSTDSRPDQCRRVHRQPARRGSGAICWRIMRTAADGELPGLCAARTRPSPASRSLAPQPAAEVLRRIEPTLRGQILTALPRARRVQIELIIRQPRQTVGAWMDTRIATARTATAAGEAVRRLALHDDSANGWLFVIGARREFAGARPARHTDECRRARRVSKPCSVTASAAARQCRHRRRARPCRLARARRAAGDRRTRNGWSASSPTPACAARCREAATSADQGRHQRHA